MLCTGYILKSASWKQCTSLVTERAHTVSSSLHLGCLERNKIPANFMVIQDASLITILPFSLVSFKAENGLLPRYLPG